MKLIEPPLAEPHERWCERSEIPQSEEFPSYSIMQMKQKKEIDREQEDVHILALYLFTVLKYRL